MDWILDYYYLQRSGQRPLREEYYVGFVKHCCCIYVHLGLMSEMELNKAACYLHRSLIFS